MRVEPPLLVREATAADARAIGEVHAEGWRAAHRDLLEVDWLNRLADHRRTRWESVLADRRLKRNTMLVAERGHRVAAFLYFGPHTDGSPDAEIFDLHVHPTAWGHGVAATLMDAAWEMLAESSFPSVRLWVMAGPNRAQRFYVSFGFTETGRRREHDFGDGRPVLEVEYSRPTR